MPDEALLEPLTAMIRTISHRGPDHEGVWCEGNMGLAQNLLAIVDVSPNSYQPMISEEGRYILVFNGEIYNYQHLAKDLQKEGIVFELHNDTQVLLQACSHWGVEKTLPKLNGMFAFAFYDKHAHRLIVARDRWGEKPLYYAYQPQQFFAFASELKALRVLPFLDTRIDETALQLYLQSSYIPCPYSIYQGVKKLFPGSYLIVENGFLHEHRYYDFQEAVSKRTLQQGSEADILEQCDQRLQYSVAERMYADVPVGAFLSGGIDSSLMVALMQRNRAQPVQTFSVGYPGADEDESKYAEEVAKYLKTDHTTIHIQQEDLLEAIASISRIYDEPMGDPAALPTYCMSKIARKTVTVVLTGDGGDEMFAGYYKHKWLPKLYQWGQWVPNGVLQGLCVIHEAVMGNFHPKLVRRIRRALGIMQKKNFLDAYIQTDCAWQVRPSLEKTWFALHPDLPNNGEQVMFCDVRTQLTDEFLCKVDRATMAASLEARAPLLDYNLLDFVWSIPFSKKLRQGEKKYLLRSVLRRYVPQALWDRPKIGFGMPLGTILRTALQSTFERYLAADTLIWRFLNRAYVQSLWEQHQKGKISHERTLWNFFVAQQFLLGE